MERRDKFAGLVALACHDLRTPLAAVHGFARTLQRSPLPERETRYVDMIDGAAVELAELIDVLALLARMEAGRYRPVIQLSNTLDLAAAARAHAGEDAVDVGGPGGPVAVDREAVESAIAAFVDAARRHGGVGRVEVEGRAGELRVTPVTAEAAPVLLGEKLHDLRAATAGVLVQALGGSVGIDGRTLVIRLPVAIEEAGRAAGP